MTEEAVYRTEEEKYRQLVRALPLLSVFRPEWQALLPVRISQPYVVLANHSGGATRPRQKFDDIFIRFDTIPACDGQTCDDSNSRAMQSVARVKRWKWKENWRSGIVRNYNSGTAWNV